MFLHHKSQVLELHIGKMSLDAENYPNFKFSILEEQLGKMLRMAYTWYPRTQPLQGVTII